MSSQGGRSPATVLLADEQSLFRQAVRAVLDAQPDLRVVGEAGDGFQAVVEAERVQPDVALLSEGLPGCDGVAAAAMIRERVGGCRVIIVGSEEDEGLLMEAIEAGANGFLTKGVALADLIDSVRAVHRGETLVPPAMLGPLLSNLIRRRREQDEALRRLARLTRREREVLLLLVEGADNETIARELVISPQTARTHVQNLLSKLEVHSRLEAAAFVRRNGVVGHLVEESRGTIRIPESETLQPVAGGRGGGAGR